jgi:hypothetical protein
VTHPALAKVASLVPVDAWRHDLTSARAMLDELTKLDRPPSPEEVTSLQKKIVGAANVNATNDAEPFDWIDAATLAQPLPPVPWVLEGLQLGPGRPCSLQSYGAGMKSLTAGAIAVGLAADVPVFGTFRARDVKRVRIFDYEMGQRAWRRRLQRLALGYGVELTGLDLKLAALPRIGLTDASALEAFTRGTEGVDFAVVDSFRAACRGADENDSSVREYLDILLEVSEKTGVAWLVLHHTGKDKAGHDDGRQKGRGSSAIFDAWGTVLDLSKESETTRLVTMTKPHPESTGPTESFFLEVVDVALGLDPKAAVSVRYRTKEQVHPPDEHNRQVDLDLDRIVSAVRAAGRDGVRGADAIALKAGMKAQRARPLVRLAVDRGDLINVATLQNGTSDERHPRYVARPVPLKGGTRDECQDARPDEQGTRGTRGTSER